MSIDIQGVRKAFGKFVAVNDVSFRVATGELVALLGPSGSGKTTLLRIVAGLERPDAGTVRFNGVDVTSERAQDRKVGFVFQHYALFRHMSIFENVAFGLRVMPRRDRPGETQIKERVMELLHLVQVDWLAGKYPHQLSGGQRQRVALARALAVQPSVLLLDEPFGALDAKVRKELRRWLRRLHDELHITSVFITHDQEEALELADRVVVMNEGRVEQIDTPETVYEHPANLFVYNFLGHVNLFRGRVESGKVYVGDVAIEAPAGVAADSASAVLAIRPHLVDLRTTPQGAGWFRARVTRILAVGPQVKVEMISEWGDRVDAEIDREAYRQLALVADTEVFFSSRGTRVFVEGAEA